MTHHNFLSRRDALLRLAGIALAGAAPSRDALADIKFSSDPFALGVASGSPSDDGFVLWTRLVDAGLDGERPVQVDWELFEDDSLRVVRKGTAVATPELGYAVHVEVTGLENDKWYRYKFRAGGAVSAMGRTRTFPSPASHPKRLRFAYASCQRWEDGYYAAYRQMAEENLDLVVFVGDYIYEYRSRSPRNAVRTHKLRESITLQDYRDRYALYRSDFNLQRMHAACPWLVTWDDHEVENDYAGPHSTKGTSEFADRRICAYQAFYEHMPLRASSLVVGVKGLPHDGALRLYEYFDFGRLARLYMLDDRQYRDAPACGLNPPILVAEVCQPNSAEDRSILGKNQEDWLAMAMGAARKNESEWNVICQQTGFTPRNYARGAGKNFSRDGWDGFWTARQRLIDTIVNYQIRNPMILGGDIHQNWVANVHQNPYDATSPIIASEFCGTSITSRNDIALDKASKIVASNPHCLFNNTQLRGYGVAEVTPERTTVALRVVDDVTREDSTVSTLASFVVDRGRPQIRATS